MLEIEMNFFCRLGKTYENVDEMKLRLGAAQNCSATTKRNHQLTDIVLPESGFCGSCWTFSTTGAAYHQAFGKAIYLSEQQLVDCAGAFYNFGCNGGLPSQAFEYIKYNGGLDMEEAYPYTAKTINAISHLKMLGSEAELKHAVGVVRPASVAFEVISDFRVYKSGVYTNDKCGSTSTASPFHHDVNHAVLAVGYGVENGVHYWLIKNSWGAKWGDNGYFKIEMGKNMCGVATCASYLLLLDPDRRTIFIKAL
ncbi:Thiol protease aleurain [Hibiscus syriacus]|uniref:Thiol protease aleurain n=1 Tax=Hibiscus syriacus TaxID=106335 RepID=A0A6A2XKB4_HIBSY|nr:Thiol protease aleurain [Hibiscus syriacus]